MDARRLFVPVGHASMFQYCVHELHMSEETAFRRIRAARLARKFPAMFDALADGRLHLTAVVLLAPHLRPKNADELLAAVTHKTRREVERLLAERFPQPDVPTLVRAIGPSAVTPASAECVDAASEPPALAAPLLPCMEPVSAMTMEPLAPAPVVPCPESKLASRMEPLPSRARLAPLSPGRFAMQVTLDQETFDLLRYVQALLGHAVPSGEIAEVLKRSLRELAHKLERQKFAATTRPRPRRSAANGRYVPAEIRRAVWERDAGQCTFVGEHGRRCEERSRLEFDHVEPVARGGMSTVNGLRLRCRAHNQYAAECTFGAEFMRGKREQVR
jgi:hypothetical protein